MMRASDSAVKVRPAPWDTTPKVQTPALIRLKVRHVNGPEFVADHCEDRGNTVYAVGRFRRLYGAYCDRNYLYSEVSERQWPWSAIDEVVW